MNDCALEVDLNNYFDNLSLRAPLLLDALRICLKMAGEKLSH